jgi:hypothetical protein
MQVMVSGRKSSHYYTISNIFSKLTLGGAIYVATTVDMNIYLEAFTATKCNKILSGLNSEPLLLPHVINFKYK